MGSGVEIVSFTLHNITLQVKILQPLAAIDATETVAEQRAATINLHAPVTASPVHHCGLVESARTWDGTGREFDSWKCQIYIISHVYRAYDYSGPFGVL